MAHWQTGYINKGVRCEITRFAETYSPQDIMQLLDEIVDLLSTQKGSLTDALLKTKVLLDKIGHGELAEWADRELHGYPDRDKLPPYRRLHAEVRAHVTNMAYHYESHPIPLHHLTDKERMNYEVAKIADSLAVLEVRTAKAGGSL